MQLTEEEFNAILTLAKLRKKQYKGLRIGQSFYNILLDFFLDTQTEVLNTECDMFFADANLGIFKQKYVKG